MTDNDTTTPATGAEAAGTFTPPVVRAEAAAVSIKLLTVDAS